MTRRYCLEPGCPVLLPASQRRCPAHQRVANRRYALARHPAAAATYRSSAWKELARATVANADACHWCGTSVALVKLTADHVILIREDPDLALAPENVVPSCRSCQQRRVYRPDVSKWHPSERSPRRR